MVKRRPTYDHQSVKIIVNPSGAMSACLATAAQAVPLGGWAAAGLAQSARNLPGPALDHFRSCFAETDHAQG